MAIEGVLLSSQEVARQLAVHESTVVRLLHRGEFPNAFKVGRAWKIPQTDLEAYVEKQWRERQAATSTLES